MTLLLPVWLSHAAAGSFAHPPHLAAPAISRRMWYTTRSGKPGGTPMHGAALCALLLAPFEHI